MTLTPWRVEAGPSSPNRPRRWAMSSQALLVVQVFLLSRALMVLVSAALTMRQDLTPASMASNWDVQHFMGIAANGYTDPTSPAFFPGLPLLMAGGAAIGVPMWLTGVLVGLAGSALAAAALFRIGGAPAACCWLLAPTAVFTAVGYTEAPFCAAAFWAWRRARDGRWGQAAALAAVACAFRISGVFLLVGLGVLALLRRGWASRLTSLAWLLAPVAVLAAFEWYLHGVTGSWTAWLDAQQQGWTRSFANPLAALRHTIDAGRLTSWPGRPDVAWVFRAEIVAMLAGVAVTVWALVRRRWAEAAVVGVQVVVFGTSYWYMSVNRALLVWWPLWLALGAAVTRCWRKQTNVVAWRALVVVYYVVSTSMMLVWSWLFFTGRWAS